MTSRELRFFNLMAEDTETFSKIYDPAISDVLIDLTGRLSSWAQAVIPCKTRICSIVLNRQGELQINNPSIPPTVENRLL